jgi:hypothetical protein
VRTNCAAVHFDDGSADRQAEPKPFPAAIHLFEGLKDLLEKLRFDPDAIVTDLNR